MENSSSKIKILPENLTNKIAAGEVVDRPASVAKELVENAIDAGADEITVILKDGGRALIQVMDNGSGMSQADLLLAFQRHATSKIFTYDDLTNIRSFGFRGEALASIASVSQVEARSVVADEPSGYRLQIEGGVMNGVEAAAGNRGTTIAVKNLFYNTPARRKFLKTTSTEYRQILGVLNRFTLAYPEIAFTLVNEDEIVQELKKESLEERIVSVLGSRAQKNLVEIENTGPVQISGFVGNQDAVRRSRGDQYLFFNRRYFTSKSLNYAVVAAYGEILPRGAYPIYIIFIHMDPEQADVNVHPTKKEIKFANDALIFSSLRGCIKRALTSEKVVPEITPWQKFDDFRRYSESDLQQMRQTEPLRFEPPPRQFPGWPEKPQTPGQESHIHPETGLEKIPLIAPPQLVAPATIPFERTNVWQVHNKYIISQIKNGLIVIDQHVAHERILYEKALASFETRKPSSQQLLFPQIIELSQMDYSILLEMIPFLQHIGFVVKAFGKNTVAVEGVPSGIKISDDEKILLSILDEYKRGKRERTEIRENVAASFACHSAIRAGDSLSLEEMNALIDQLFSTKEPYFCPHGRPVIIHISLDELDKRFKRL
ncbi:MAG: DNA mismatch repair endonuclease MutL [bacterium]